MAFTFTAKGTDPVVLTISDRSGEVYRETWGSTGTPSAPSAGKHMMYISLDNGSLNTSNTSKKVDTNDHGFTGRLADGNYVWSITEGGKEIASGSFTLDRGV